VALPKRLACSSLMRFHTRSGFDLRPSLSVPPSLSVLAESAVAQMALAGYNELVAQPLKASTLSIAELGIIGRVLLDVGCGDGLHRSHCSHDGGAVYDRARKRLAWSALMRLRGTPMDVYPMV
jgi:hypothetical protein